MKKWITLLFLCLAQFCYLTDRQLFGLLVLPIQQETGLNDLQIGFIDTVLFWLLALAMLFTGAAGDRFSRKKLITVSIVSWGALTALTGLANGFLSFLLIRSVLMTGAQSLYTPCSNALIAAEHRETRTFALAAHQGALYVGLLTSGAIVAATLGLFGSWRAVYFLYGGVTFLVGVVFALFFWRDGARSALAKKDLLAGARAFFGNPAALCAGAGFIALVFVSNATAAWAPKFVAQKCGLTAGEAGKVVMFWPNVAAMATVLGAGYVTDRFVKRWPRFRLCLQVAALLVGAPMLACFGLAKGLTAVWTVLIVWGFARGLMQSNNYASVFDVVPPESRSSAVGFLVVMGCLVGSLSPLVIGALSNRYGTRGFEIGFGLMAGLLVAAAGVMAYSCIFLFMKHRARE